MSTSDLAGGDGGADSGVDASSGADAAPDSTRVDAGDSDADAGNTGTTIPAFVQQNAGAALDASAGAIALPAPVTPGNALVVAFDVQTNGTPTVDDSQAETFTVSTVSPITGPQHLYVAFLFDARGGQTTITVHTLAQTTIEMYANEYANVASLDAVVQGIGSTPATDGIQSDNITTTVPNELLFGFAVTGTGVAGTGFVQRSNFATNVTEDRVVAAPGTSRLLATMKSGTTWAILGAALKPK